MEFDLKLITTAEIAQIAEATKYSKSHVRKVVRGYYDRTERNMIIIEEANSILQDRGVDPIK